MKPSEILAKAADLIEPEGAWTQGTFAETALGRPTNSRGRWAVCWCAAGALNRATPPDVVISGGAAFLHRVIGGSIMEFNDRASTTQAQVVAKLREAAALAAAEGQ